MKELVGTGVALVTPFNEDSSVDYPSLEKLVDFVITGGVEYLVLMGTTSEYATLTADEKQKVIEVISKTNAGRLPMVLGIGTNNTQEVVNRFKNTNTQDFSAILSVSPYYNKPSQEGIYQHFKAIAQSTDQNIILYNVPGRTSSNIAAETTLRLAHDFKNIVALKEASPNFTQSTDVLKDKPSDFLVLSGDDEFALPMTLAGGKGVISVIGQGLPAQFSELIRQGLKKEVSQAYDLQYQLIPFIRLIFQECNPAGIKALLAHQGICKPFTRLPLVPATAKNTQDLVRAFQKLN